MSQKNKQKKEIDLELKLLAKSSFIVFIGIFLSKIFIYLYRVIIARYFGPEVYGLFSLSIMILGFFIAFFGLGLSEGISRFVPLYLGKKQQKKISHVFRVSVKTLFFSGIFATILLFFLSEYISVNIFHNYDLIIFLKVFSILIPVYFFSGIFIPMLRAFEKINWYVFIDNVLQNITKLVFLILFIVLGFKTEAVIFSYFLGILSMLIASFLVCKSVTPTIFQRFKLKIKTKRKINKKLFSYSWPLMFFGIISGFLYWIDSFTIGYFKTAIEVGFYNAAVPISALLWIVPNLFMPLFFPLMTKEFAKKEFGVIKESSKQVGKWVFIFNLPIFLIMFLFPGAVINILFGPEYIIAENALRFLSIGSLFLSIALISNQLISMIGKSKLILFNITIASIINIILNVLLVPMPKILSLDNSSGINGAAISTMISLIIFSLLFVFQSKKHLSIIPLRKKTIRILLVSVIPTSLLIYMKQFILINSFTLFLQGTFFILLYILLIFLTGCLDKNDIMVLKTIKNRIRR